MDIVREVQLCMPVVASRHLCLSIIRCRQQTKYRRKAFTEVTALSQVEIAKDMAAAAARGDTRRVLWCIAHCDDMSIIMRVRFYSASQQRKGTSKPLNDTDEEEGPPEHDHVHQRMFRD